MNKIKVTRSYYEEKFQAAQNKVTQVSHIRKKQYYSELIAKNLRNSKITWQIINSAIKPTPNQYIMLDIEMMGISADLTVLTFVIFVTSVKKLLTPAVMSRSVPF